MHLIAVIEWAKKKHPTAIGSRVILDPTQSGEGLRLNAGFRP